MAIANDPKYESKIKKLARNYEDLNDSAEQALKSLETMGDTVASNCYVHYFMVCGLDLNFGLEPDETNSSLEGQLSQEYNPLERSYKPESSSTTQTSPNGVTSTQKLFLGFAATRT
eukprot:TRINITY_DN19035_c0_g1_i1.p1 TRINITY_DN19035_c0_g1~~TRINITY_DN19035_c0_g1_i1.p1  ORF type:complete len:127 (+),score=36.00 TRINITY_DN19035_c0_g1_i1:35-382(+)